WIFGAEFRFPFSQIRGVTAVMHNSGKSARYDAKTGLFSSRTMRGFVCSCAVMRKSETARTGDRPG
ncbi:MAG: hypothetical protein ABIV36_23830, partial [Sphingobium limneticum]